MTMPDLDLSTLTALRELMGSDYALLVDTFMTDAEQRLQWMQRCYGAADWAALAACAHSFKGSCGNMGALALQEHCRQLEEAARAGDSARLAALLPTLEPLLQAVIRQL